MLCLLMSYCNQLDVVCVWVCVSLDYSIYITNLDVWQWFDLGCLVRDGLVGDQAVSLALNPPPMMVFGRE